VRDSAVDTAGSTPATEPAAQADFVTASSQPVNVGDAKIAALAYHDSGAYERDLNS
jgi:hypothetical protein